MGGGEAAQACFTRAARKQLLGGKRLSLLVVSLPLFNKLTNPLYGLPAFW